MQIAWSLNPSLPSEEQLLFLVPMVLNGARLATVSAGLRGRIQTIPAVRIGNSELMSLTVAEDVSEASGWADKTFVLFPL
jgi:hypothetical protein